MDRFATVLLLGAAIAALIALFNIATARRRLKLTAAAREQQDRDIQDELFW